MGGDFRRQDTGSQGELPLGALNLTETLPMIELDRSRDVKDRRA